MKKHILLYSSVAFLTLGTSCLVQSQQVLAQENVETAVVKDAIKIGDVFKTANGVKYKILTFENGKGTVQIGDGKQAIDYEGETFTIPSIIQTEKGEFIVTEIGTHAFYSTVDEGTGMRFGTNAQKVVIPNTVTKIQKRAFFSADNIKEVVISDNTTLNHIDDEAFYFSAIKKIVIPNTVKTIGSRAFSFSEQLTEVVINENSQLEVIGDNAFATLKNLKSIYIPQFVKSIGKRVLATTPKLSAITVSEHNTAYKDDNGVLYTKDGKELLQYPSMRIGEKYRILDSTEIIAEYAFENNQFLKELTFGENVTEIKDFVFKNAESLTHVYLNEKLTKIGRLSFYYMSDLKELIIPDSVVEYGNNAFYGLEKLEKLSFGTGTTQLVKGMISGNMESLKEIILNAHNLTLQEGSVDTLKSQVTFKVNHQMVKEQLLQLGVLENHIILNEKQADKYTPSYLPLTNQRAGETVQLSINGQLPQDVRFLVKDDKFSIDEKTGQLTVTISKDAKKGEVISGVVKIIYADQSTSELPFSIEVIEEISLDPVINMYRLYNLKTKQYFYTSNAKELALLKSRGWFNEGIAWQYKVITTGHNVYRMLNRVTGERVFTQNQREIQLLLSRGWLNEGVAFKTSQTGQSVYRMRNKETGRYMFTIHQQEIQKMLKTRQWQYEGIAFKLATN